MWPFTNPVSYFFRVSGLAHPRSHRWGLDQPMRFWPISRPGYQSNHTGSQRFFAGHDSHPGPDHTPRMYDWQDPIAAALDIADVVGAELTVRQGRHQAFHPGRNAEFVVAGHVIGHAGELLPKLIDAWDLPVRTAALELDLDALIAAGPRCR